MKICGLRLWQDELARVVNFHTEQAANVFLHRAVPPDHSVHQSLAAPIPPPRSPADNFMGNVIRELLALTSTRRAVYRDGGWHEHPPPRSGGSPPLLTPRTLDLLQRAIGRVGLRGLHSLLGFACASRLAGLAKAYAATCQGDAHAALERFALRHEPAAILPERATKLHAAARDALGPRLFAEIHETVGRCGTAQLLRVHLAAKMRASSQRDAPLLHATLRTADAAIVAELRSASDAGGGEGGGGGGGGGGGSAALGAVAELGPLLEATGLSHPMQQVFVAGETLRHLPAALMLYVGGQLAKMAWSDKARCLCATGGRADEQLDGVPMAAGLSCVLRQHHPHAARAFVALLAQHARAQVRAATIVIVVAVSSLRRYPPTPP